MSADLEELGIEGLTDATAVADSRSGRVYRARQPALSRTVAVKLLSEPFHDTHAWARFQQECFAMGMLGGHPNIVQVYDAGFTAAGRSFIVMDYVAGGSLEQRVQRDGPFDWRAMLVVAVKLAGALHTAHSAGVAHGEVSLSAILLSQYGEPQLTDFGLTGLRHGERATVAADVSDLAAAMLRLLGERRVDVPEDVLHLLERASHTTRGDDLADAAAFGEAVQELQRSHGLPVTRLPIGGVQEYDPPPLQPQGRRPRAPALVMSLAAVALVAVLGLALTGSTEPPVPLLEADMLGSAWITDPELRSTVLAEPDGYLCRDARPASSPATSHSAAFRAGTPGPRIANSVRAFDADTAAALLATVRSQSACLNDLGGLRDVAVTEATVGDEAVEVRYRRPTASLPVEVVVLYARRGGVVTTMTHLGYPHATAAVTDVLRRAAASQLRAQE